MTRMPGCRTRCLAALLLASAVAACGSGSARAPVTARPAATRAPAAPAPPAGGFALASAGDEYARVTEVTHAYGPTLRVDGAPLTRSFVGFELAAVPQRIVRATLSVYALSGSRPAAPA